MAVLEELLQNKVRNGIFNFLNIEIELDPFFHARQVVAIG